MPFNHLILCLHLLFPPSVFPSIRVFSNELVLRIRWPKYWSFSFSISPSNEYSGLISFRIDWLDLLAVQGTLKSLLQYHSSKASSLLCSAFFIFTFFVYIFTCCCTWAFSICGRWGLLSSCGEQASHCSGFSSWEQGTGSGSVDVACGLSCPAACGIFLNQRSNTCPLHWQVNS